MRVKMKNKKKWPMIANATYDLPTDSDTRQISRYLIILFRIIRKAFNWTWFAAKLLSGDRIGLIENRDKILL